ncbi:MAG: helix-turn-helix domain-containing protein [Eubacteriales bacterium]
MEKLTYNVGEVAEVLGISKSFTYQLIKEKKIPTLDLGQRKVVPIAALERWIENSVKEKSL